VIRSRSEKSGQSYRGKAGHRRPAEKAQVANVSENEPSNVEAWRRTYMRHWRGRSRAAGATESEKQPQVEGEPGAARQAAEAAAQGQAEGSLGRSRRGDEDARREHADGRAARHDEATGSAPGAHVGVRRMTASGSWIERTGGGFRPGVKPYLGGGLRPAVEAYLGGAELSGTGLMVLRQYLQRSITAPNWRGGGVESLRERVEYLDTREKLKEWLSDARELGIDPL
jgi:hypothetical protein